MDIAELLAREEIRDKCYRYCRAIDRLDPYQNENLFWDDANFVGGPFPDDMPAAEFLKIGLTQAVSDVFALSSHSLFNIIMDFQGPDVSYVESYALCYHHSYPSPEGRARLIGRENDAAMGFAPEDVIEMELQQRYFDRWEKRGGEWRIKHRRLIIDWSRIKKYSGISSGGLYDSFVLRGSRSTNDPIYLRD